MRLAQLDSARLGEALLALHGADGVMRAEAICRAGFLGVQRGLFRSITQLQAAVGAASIPAHVPATER